MDEAYDLSLYGRQTTSSLCLGIFENSAAFVYLTHRELGHALILGKLIVVSTWWVYDKVESVSDFLIY